jgi:hypothetical protein
MTVETQHPQYKAMATEWRLVRALVAGPREVKQRDVVKELLPNPDLDDEKRYKDYITRAIYTNFTGRTKIGLSGAAFRKEPTLGLPTGLDYMEEDANGGGLSLKQLIKDVLGDLFSSGREILLVDFPQSEEGMTAEQTRNLQARILRYSPMDLVNWGSNFAVLREQYNVSEDEFDHEMATQYRVLRLGPTGYTQQVYRDGEPVTEEVEIKKASGERFDFMPLIAVGAQNNDINVDEIPLADIAHVNAGHFRNSADLEENCFIHSALTLGISTNMDSDTWKEANPNGVVVGARAGVYLGENGSFHAIQADPNNLADQLMERKENQMVQLGARIIEKRTQGDTATAARIDATGENSVLGDIVDNVEDAFNKCLEWCGLFMNVETTGDELTMNREFFDNSVDPQAAIAAMQYYDRGLITKPDIIQVGRKAGFVSEDTTEEELLNGMLDPGLMTNDSNGNQEDSLE